MSEIVASGRLSGPELYFALWLSFWLALLWRRPVLVVAATAGLRGGGRHIGLKISIVAAACAAVQFFVLRRCSAAEVKDAPRFLLLYLTLGAIWVTVSIRLFVFVGLSFLDDVLERGNPAAGIAFSGLSVGLTFCFAGANIGEGPGPQAVLFSAALPTAGLMFLWLLAACWTGWADRITVDRDFSSGLRAAGLFVATGIIFGRAAAGDWKSASATSLDFLRIGGTALPMWAVASGIEYFDSKTTVPSPDRDKGLVRPALVSSAYIGWSFGMLAIAGLPR